MRDRILTLTFTRGDTEWFELNPRPQNLQEAILKVLSLNSEGRPAALSEVRRPSEVSEMSTEVFTETPVPEAETKRYVEREWDGSRSTLMCTNGSPVQQATPPGVDVCYNVCYNVGYNVSSDGSFARQHAGYVSSELAAVRVVAAVACLF